MRRIHLRQMLAEDFAPVEEVDEAVRLSAADPDSWQYSYALAEQARVAVWTADPAALDLAERALAVAERAGHPRALCYALTARAMVEVAAGAGGGRPRWPSGTQAAVAGPRLLGLRARHALGDERRGGLELR